jgi:hypothetical protein
MSVNLEKTIRSISKKMLIDFETIRDETHPGIKGKTREGIVRDFLRKYLPKRFGIAYGKVVSSNGNSSKEQDIIIYDEENCPIFFQEEDIKIIPCEEVYAVIQVKSYLNSEELKDCVENIRSVKVLPKTAYYEQGLFSHHVNLYGKEYDYFPTMGVVFAYDSIDLETVAKKLIEKNNELKLDFDQRIDYVCVLTKGLIFHSDPRLVRYPSTFNFEYKVDEK